MDRPNFRVEVSRSQVLRMIEREWIVWKRTWGGSVFSAFVAPVLYLAAMGVGLGDLIDKSSGNVSGVSYLAFVAPGLLAASLAMNSAGESLWPVRAGSSGSARITLRCRRPSSRPTCTSVNSCGV